MISTSATWFAFFLFAGVMTYAGIKDVATMTISNRLVGALATFTFFAFGWIGGGDAKLLPVAMLWLGANLSLPFVIYASLFGAALTLALVQFRQVPLPIGLKERAWCNRLHAREAGIPYAAAMAPAALLLLPESHWFSALI
jgi:prepilin peptidase CpaA